MDSFRLLTKGTKLAKDAGSGQPSVLPSSGPARNPQVLADPVVDKIENVNQQATKRKRESQENAPVPDFFTYGAVTDTVRAQDGALKKAKTIKSSEEPPFMRKSEAECQQILRKHKIKVTLMKSVTKKKIDKGKTSLLPLTPQPLETFASLRSRFKISRRLAENLAEHGYRLPTEVQLGAIPLLLGNDEDRGLQTLSRRKEITQSHVDLLSIAPTGSGKTLAFLIPVIQGILNIKHQSSPGEQAEKLDSYIKAIILAPTHELADQIVNECRKLVQGTGLRVTGMKKDMRVLRRQSDVADTSEDQAVVRTDILVATPAVLANTILEAPSGRLAIPSVRYLVLDEADVLLDPLFREQTLSIWNACTNPHLQSSLWSATIGASIEDLAQDIITTRRKELKISSKNHYLIRLVAGLKDSALPTVSHRLIYAATEQGKLLAVRQILHPTGVESDNTLRPPFLIFTQTISRATALHSELLYDIPIEAGGSSRIAVLHSSLSNTLRSEVMTRFRKGEIWVLITTDLLSRGIDFRGVNGVVNYDIPTTSAAYIHRAGRTGRAGREGGIAVTLYTKEDIPYVKNVANVIAACERVHGNKSGMQDGKGIPQWLLDALPDVSKKIKKELKRHGVKERAANAEGSKGRISTKSGFQRQLEDKKKGAMRASKRRTLEEEAESGQSGSESEWAGLQD